MKKVALLLSLLLVLFVSACSGETTNQTTDGTTTVMKYAGNKEKDITYALIAYMGTVEGKAIIENAGVIYTVGTGNIAWDDIKGDYPVCSEDNSDVTIYLGGSTSVQKTAENLTADFKSKCGDFTPNHNHTGSSDGFKRTQGAEKDSENALHIGFASRGFKSTENGAIGTQGQLGTDAVVAIVNEANAATGVTAAQLKDFYENGTAIGTATTGYTRDTSSGTREAFFKGISFKDAVEDNSVLVNGYVEVTGNSTMISGVAADATGLGYISLSSLATADGVKGLNYEGVEATVDNVLSGEYLLSRPFNYVVRAEWS